MTADEPRPMQIDDLFRFHRISEPRLSPDGTLVAFVVGRVNLEENRASSEIWIAPWDGRSPARPLTRTDKKDSCPRWSPDGRFILFQSNRSGKSQLWCIPLSGGEATQLTDLSTEASNGVWSPQGDRIAFTSAVFPEFSELPFAESDPANKEKLEKLEKGPVKARVFTRLFFRHWDSYVEGKRQHIFVAEFDPVEVKLKGEPRDVTPGDRDAVPTSMTFSVGDDYCFSPDGSHLIFNAVPAENEAWNTAHELCRVPVSGGSTNWPRLRAGPAADGAPRFSPDGKQFAFRAQTVPMFEADKWDVYTVSCRPDGSWTSEPRCVTKDIDRSAENVDWTLSSDGVPCVTFLTQDRGRVVRCLTDPQGKSKPQLIPEKSSIDFISYDALGRHYVILGSALNHPPEVFANGKLLSRLNDALVSQIDWGQVDSLEVPGADGVPMQMWIVKPPGFDPSRKWPVVYLVHGGPQGAWLHGWSNRWNPAVWAAQGYVVALPNPRGSTGFGQEYTNQISGDWGGRCFEDLMCGVAYLESLPYIDAQRMAAAGASFGGYMMNWFQGKTDKFKTLIAHCGVYNFESMYGTTEELWFDEYEHGGPPWGENRHSYEQQSPHRLAARFKTPMLIIHNDLDFRVPVSEGLQMFTTLQRLGVPSRMINFPDEGHWVLKPANSKFWHEQIFAWLREYCPPGAS